MSRSGSFEHTLQALRPGHGLVALFECFVFVFFSGASFAAFGRRHIDPVFAVGRKYTMESGQVYPGLWHLCSQLGDEIQRLDKIVRNDFEQLQLARRAKGRKPGVTSHAWIHRRKAF